MLELGAPPGVLASVGGAALDAETIRAIGQRYQLDALLVAELHADQMDPYQFMRQARSAARRSRSPAPSRRASSRRAPAPRSGT